MTENKEVIAVEKKDPNKTLRFWTSILGVVALIVLIGFKLADMISLKYTIIIGVALAVVWLFAFFGKSLTDKVIDKPEIKVRELPSKEKIEQILEETAGERMWDHIKKPDGIKEVTTKTRGDDTILYALVDLLNKSALGEESEYVFIINLSDTNIIPTTIPKSEAPKEIVEMLINDKSRKPEEQPDRIVKRVSLDHFNRPMEETEEIKHKPKDEKKEEGGVA